jgi:hypothetical protein
MLSCDIYTKEERIITNLELGSYNTELLMYYLAKPSKDCIVSFVITDMRNKDYVDLDRPPGPGEIPNLPLCQIFTTKYST